jgi:hypothetical protein
MGIHSLILNKVLEELQKGLVDDIPEGDPTRAGVVMIGALQGDPAPDVARISVSLFTNDPDAILGNVPSGLKTDWEDMVYLVEVGGSITHWRRFTVKVRCLFSNTREDQVASLDITDTVRDRVEKILAKISFAGINTAEEFVSRGITAKDIKSEMLQAGGPPDAFDYSLKIRFSVLTTRNGEIP